MARLKTEQIQHFFGSLAAEDLRGGRCGIERETLRVAPNGFLAQTPHPSGLGSALTHPFITTDFSEALLEFVTPAETQPWEVVQFLCDLHQFTHRHIGEERLWPLSMPCAVEGDARIPLARYGTSNVGQMKTIYRRGLGYRYGRTMQTIAGVHFNYSPGPGFWSALAESRGDRRDPQTFQSAAYFALVRNFRRYAWLVLYLFGASPAVCRTFLQGRDHALQAFDPDTLYLPYATSLRMSDLGYSSAAQSRLNISLNSLGEYVEGLTRAIETPYPPYEAIGVVVDGRWRQLSSNILQIANEFYSVVRPKRVAKSGEKPTTALRERGVEYVEIRALDLSPDDPVGVSQDQMRFLETLLLYCAVVTCDVISAAEQVDVDRNQAVVAARGREPGLELKRDGRTVTLRRWASETFDDLTVIAGALDAADGGEAYAAALARYRSSVDDPAQTPSARVLEAMREQGASHAAYGLDLAGRHKDYFAQLPELGAARDEQLRSAAARSLARQSSIEAADRVDFATYLRNYFAQP